MLRIIIHGAGGTMGGVMARYALSQPDIAQVVAGVDKFPPKEGTFPFPVYSSWADCHEQADAIIDFSLPAALPGLLEAALERKYALVIATTGLSADDLALIAKASAEIPILRAANMSLGVNLQMDLIKRATALLGDNYDIEILERHHNKKVDAPSGTALALADAINSVLPQEKRYVYTRHDLRQKREKSELGIAVIRGGTMAGTHEVGFYGDDEIIQITHTAVSKTIFAVGALKGARFLVNLPPKLYSFAELVADTNSVTNIQIENEQSVVKLKDTPFDAEKISEVFELISDAGVNIDMISQSAPHESAVDISFSVASGKLEKAISALKAAHFLSPESYSGLAKLTVEGGSGMAYERGIAARTFRALASIGVAPKLISTSETKILICVDQPLAEQARAAIAKEFGI